MTDSVYLASLDLETTDLSTFNGRFVQMGACIFHLHLPTATFTPVGNFELNCRSTVKMHPKSIEITGITQEFVDKQTLSAKDVLNKFQTFVEKSCKDGTPRAMVSWNGHSFDGPFIIFEAHRSQLGAENYFRTLKFTSSLDALVAAKFCLDTTSLTRNASGQCSYKLGSVYQALLKKPLKNAHGGLADATAVIDIIKAAFNDFKPYLIAAATGEYEKLQGVMNTMTLVRNIASTMPKEQTGKVNVLKRLADIVQKNTKKLKTEDCKELTKTTENNTTFERLSNLDENKALREFHKQIQDVQGEDCVQKTKVGNLEDQSKNEQLQNEDKTLPQF